MAEGVSDFLSKNDDEHGSGASSLGVTHGLDLSDFKISNTTDTYSASEGGIIDSWDTDFRSLETLNGSEKLTNELEQSFVFESNFDMECGGQTKFFEGRFADVYMPFELEEKSFNFAFRNCSDGYLVERLKGCTQSLLSILEEITMTNGNHAEGCTLEEPKVKMLEKKIKGLQDENLKLAFTRDLLLDHVTETKDNIKLKVLHDKFRYANSLAKLAYEKKKSLEEELKKLKRHVNFIQIRLCATEEENYRIKKENGQFKTLIQNLLTEKKCNCPDRIHNFNVGDAPTSKATYCKHGMIQLNLEDKVLPLNFKRFAIQKNGIPKASKELNSFNFLEDDDLEVDGHVAKNDKVSHSDVE